jgi:photosystem II stability/assembly factor-like uncharacterized protein
VVVTSEGAYAVADGGVLLKRESDTWSVVLNDGPSSNSNDLFGVAATADGDHIWFVGASGAIGEYDVTSGSLVQDHSAPNDVTNNFQDVAVTDVSGEANVYVTGGSGKVYTSTDNGNTWNEATPGDGSAIRAINTYDVQSGHIVDADQSVFETTDGGGTWEDAGIADADVSFYGVDSYTTDLVWVAAGNGTVYHWNGSEWTSTDVGEADLQDLELVQDGQSGYAVGASGAAFAYDGSSWAVEDTPTSNNLNAVVLGTDTTPPIAVGDGGTVIER